MLELYQYDLSPFAHTDLNQDGEFGYAHLDRYWSDPGRYPFLAKVAGKLIGFALVNTHHHVPGSDYSMAEFFIMKRYRRRRFGRVFALHVFDTCRGLWEVRQLPGHMEAIRFWNKVIRDYTSGVFEEKPDGYGAWKGPILRFNNIKLLQLRRN
jgi:predicted acetyltransferase